MPDRKFTYQVEIDANQARSAAQQLRRVFEQELRNVNVGGGGVGGGASRGGSSAGGIGPNISGGLASALGYSVAGFGVGMVAGRTLAFAKELSELNRAARIAQIGLVALVGSETEAAARAGMVQDAMGGAVSKIEAMQKATQLAALGFADTRQEMDRFIRAAQGASMATGRDVDYITQQMTLAISNQSLIRLDQLGLNIAEVKGRISELKAANADWTTEMLYSEAVLGRLEEKYGTLATAAKENASGFAQLAAAWTDAKTAISGIGTPLDKANAGMAEYIRNSLDAHASMSLLTGMIASSDPAMLAFRDRLFEIAAAAASANDMTGDLTSQVAALNAMLSGAPGRQTQAPGVGPLPGVLGGGFDPLTGYGQGGASSFYQARRDTMARTAAEAQAKENAQAWRDIVGLDQRQKAELDRQNAEKASRDWESAANDAAHAWEQAAQEFESRLSRVPGLMGTSDTSQSQLDMAKLGVPQNFADNYLRRLSDEVLNKTDWADVDLGEAARLGGIDQGLPPEAQLALFRQKWENSSLFANPDALRLIDQGAVRSALAEQQAGEAGRSNILKLFGLDEGGVSEADQAKLLGTGVNLVNEIHNGFSDQAAQKDWVGAITNALIAQAAGVGATAVAASSAPAPLGDLSGALGITP